MLKVLYLLLVYTVVDVVRASCTVDFQASPVSYTVPGTEIVFTATIEGTLQSADVQPQECEDTFQCDLTPPVTCTCSVFTTDPLQSSVTAEIDLQCNGEQISKTASSFRNSTCGDGVLDSVEECDDGNTEPADGCSSTCTAEPCTYSQGFWKNMHKPPLATPPAHINISACLDGCGNLYNVCNESSSGLNDTESCEELLSACTKICNNATLYYELSYPRRRADYCTNVAAQWFAAVMNFFWGGAVHGFDPIGSPIPLDFVRNLSEFDALLLCADECVESELNTGVLHELAQLLEDYNLGAIGPGHCPDGVSTNHSYYMFNTSSSGDTSSASSSSNSLSSSSTTSSSSVSSSTTSSGSASSSISSSASSSSLSSSSPSSSSSSSPASSSSSSHSSSSSRSSSSSSSHSSSGSSSSSSGSSSSGSSEPLPSTHGKKMVSSILFYILALRVHYTIAN